MMLEGYSTNHLDALQYGSNEETVVGVLDLLSQMRKKGSAQTTGLSDDVILDFASHDSHLVTAIEDAYSMHSGLSADEVSMDEKDLIVHLQKDYVNFYSPATINPYVAIAAKRYGLPTTAQLFMTTVVTECLVEDTSRCCNRCNVQKSRHGECDSVVYHGSAKALQNELGHSRDLVLSPNSLHEFWF